jgi:hypothetical protein
MVYLKCSRCGHYNEVRSEYITFCTRCNKKIEDNFPDWKKKNPDKSFDEFKKTVCSETASEPELKPAKRHPKSLKYWVGFLLFFSIFYAIGQFGGETILKFFRKPMIDKTLMETANELNKSCPLMVDNITRLDNTIALPDKVFQYNYTVVNVVKDSIKTDDLKLYLQPRILNEVRTNPAMKFVRDNHVTVNYSYKDKIGVFLFDITVKPEQYLK